jgi:hypothetical protein
LDEKQTKRMESQLVRCAFCFGTLQKQGFFGKEGGRTIQMKPRFRKGKNPRIEKSEDFWYNNKKSNRPGNAFPEEKENQNKDQPGKGRAARVVLLGWFGSEEVALRCMMWW